MTKKSTHKASVKLSKQKPQEPCQLVEFEALSHDEQFERLRLERKVERAFYEAGKALQELRDRRLYRSTHQTFEQYCSERFGFTRRRPYQLIDASIIVDNLLSEAEEMCTNRTQNETDEMCANRTQILPTSEWQVRPLTKLEPDEQVEAWTQAVEQAGGKVPSGSLVKSIVEQIRECKKIHNPWRVNEVCRILVKDNPDLRGKGGCWAVITEVHDFSCTVTLWDGNYQVKPENLSELPYSNEHSEAVRKLSERLSKLYHPKMEETAKSVLSSLGRIDRSWLTEIEESLLGVLEAKIKQ